MASTNKTVNYELSQFEGTDKPSWEADYNADMLSIDTNLKAVSDVADGASGSVSTLADRVTTAEGNISTNANDIDALEARADALESGETIADGRLDALEAEQLIQNTAIEGNTQLGYNLARPYDSASTYAVGAYVLFQNTLYKCTTAVTLGEAFDPTKWLAIKATDEIAGAGASNYVAFGDETGAKLADITSLEIKHWPYNTTTSPTTVTPTITNTTSYFRGYEIGDLVIFVIINNITFSNYFTLTANEWSHFVLRFSINQSHSKYSYLNSLTNVRELQNFAQVGNYTYDGTYNFWNNADNIGCDATVSTTAGTISQITSRAWFIAQK